MTAENDIKKRAVQVLLQHHDLEKRTNRLLGMLSHDVEWGDVARELGELYDVLTDHFELEGRGGYMQDVREALPERIAVIEELEQAHRTLEETLREVRKECARAADDGRLKDLFQKWLSDLVTHEEAENRICEEAFGRL